MLTFKQYVDQNYPVPSQKFNFEPNRKPIREAKKAQAKASDPLKKRQPAVISRLELIKLLLSSKEDDVVIQAEDGGLWIEFLDMTITVY